MRTLATLIPELGWRLHTARTSARPQPRSRLRTHNKALHFTWTTRWRCLTPPVATCSYPGCTRPAVMYPGDHHWNYCSESHEQYVLIFHPPDVSSLEILSSLAREGCIYCRQADENGTQLCKRCNEALKPCTPTLIPVPEDHDAFWNGRVPSAPGAELHSFNFRTSRRPVYYVVGPPNPMPGRPSGL